MEQGVRVCSRGELPETPNLKTGEGVSDSLRNPRKMTSPNEEIVLHRKEDQKMQ